MIKILKKGEIPNYKMLCPFCNTLFTFTKNDVQLNLLSDHYVECPTCNKLLSYKRRLK